MNPFSKTALLLYISVLEKVLAAFVLLATLVYAVTGGWALLSLDWSLSTTFFTSLEYLLYIGIGIELARLLIDYSLETLVELLAFVIAGKILLAGSDPFAVLLLAVTLLLLFATRFYFVKDADDTLGRRSTNP